MGVFLKMASRSCVSGCGLFLTSSDGHDRCPSCLGFRHAEAALVDESCSHCGNMTIAMLRSRYLLASTIGVRLLPSARGWMIGSWGRRPNVGNRPRFRSSRKCMRRWLGLGRHLFLPEAGLVPPPSSPPSTAERPRGMWRSPQSSAPLPCSFARRALPPGGVIHAFRPGPVSSRPL